MICGYCQDVGKATQGLKPSANITAWAKLRETEKNMASNVFPLWDMPNVTVGE